MTEIPESLLRRSAEAKAKALGLPVEQVLAEMKGEAPPTPPPSAEPEPETAETEAATTEPEAGTEEELAEDMQEAAERSEDIEEAIDSVDEEPEPIEETPTEGAAPPSPDVVTDTDAEVPPEAPKEAPTIEDSEEALTPPAAAVATAVEDRPAPEGNGAGNGKVAAVVSPRPTVPPKGTPEGVRTQRLLTVVKARAIQTVKAEPTDKVNTWPHLMLMEFGALLAITGFLVILSVIIHSPLLDPANFNATPNPSKAPWYFLGLQELLSYFDPQIAGVMIPTVTGIIGFMMVPYVDKNPSTRPSDRKFAIALYSVFLAGAATLTIFGVLFRGLGFNFSYPWKDGVYFDDLKDWVHFE
ncbi:MAG TPA: hypothetical protein VLA91_10055 [Acidimicrobiia bacterium]|nr:hypothetical protein [Acidimicrobiia bacterium]